MPIINRKTVIQTPEESAEDEKLFTDFKDIGNQQLEEAVKAIK